MPVVIATCFRGFSTFVAKPLINIHDLSALPGHRGQGIGRQLLKTVERKATEIGCCRLTLEVQENNSLARGLHDSQGFGPAVYGDTTERSLFYVKPL